MCPSCKEIYQESIEIDVQRNRSSNLRKSLTIIYNVRKGTKIYCDILVEDGGKPRCCNKWNIKLSKDINWDTTFDKVQKIPEIKLK